MRLVYNPHPIYPTSPNSYCTCCPTLRLKDPPQAISIGSLGLRMAEAIALEVVANDVGLAIYIGGHVDVVFEMWLKDESIKEMLAG